MFAYIVTVICMRWKLVVSDYRRYPSFKTLDVFREIQFPHGNQEGLMQCKNDTCHN